MASKYVRKSNRKVIYTEELLIEVTQRILNCESQKKRRHRSGHKKMNFKKTTESREYRLDSRHLRFRGL
jgi:hypothetical protein